MSYRVARACRLISIAFFTMISIGCSGHSSEVPEESAQTLAFPGAMGWAADTKGGRGGEVIRVTTLAAEGPGSLREALEAEGPRIVVFEVAGVIDLEGGILRIKEPYITIAGQTAPSPGVTIIKGGMVISSHDVIVQHLRIRPGDLGEPPRSGRDIDAITTSGAYNVIVDHNSLTWATDENLSASGPRFTGATPDEWREGASHKITFTNNLIAEALAHATHAKGEHSKGSLIHDNTSQILIARNLYAHNYERSPLFKSGARGAIVNNFIYNPGQRAIHYNLQGLEWGDEEYQMGELTVVGNVMRGGRDTPEDQPLVMLGGNGSAKLFMAENIAVDAYGNPLPTLGRYTTDAAQLINSDEPLVTVPNLDLLEPETVEASVLKNVGARPWDRDANDVRILADVAEGRGEIIDSQEEVGGYPAVEPVRHEFDPADWDLDTMTPVSQDVLDHGSAARGT